jgi:hypothetical protein
LYRIHVDLIDIRALLPINLNIHKMAIHVLCRLGVGEGFVLHYVAPMAAAIANADKHQLFFGFGFIKGFIAPWVPIHRIRCMLK